MSLVGSTVAPFDIARVPSETVVCAVRPCVSVSVPAPVFSSEPAVGAEMMAETPEATETDGAVSVLAPVIEASAVKRTLAAEASAARVAVPLARAKIELLPSAHVAVAPSFVQASTSPQFVCVPFQV